MKKVNIVLITGITVLLGIFLQTSAQAKDTGYTVVKSSWPAKATMYHAKNLNNNAYVWTSTKHTKKLANIKNYPNTSWQSRGTVVLKHNGKKAVYYAVTAVSPTQTKKHVSGYIWRGYMTKGYNPDFSQVKSINLSLISNSEYASFIKQSPSQSLTRAVLKLFPNSSVSVELTNYGFLDSAKSPLSIHYKNIYLLQDLNKYLLTSTSQSNNQRLAKIKSYLATAGFTGEKLNESYTIGISFGMPNNDTSKNDSDYTEDLVLAQN